MTSIGHFRVPLCLCFKASLIKCETILAKMTDLHENETACTTHFHMKGFALRLVLKQRHKRTQQWPGLLLVFSVTPFKIDQNKKSKPFNRLSPESGNRKKVHMQRLSPRFRSQQFFSWKICEETFSPNL